MKKLLLLLVVLCAPAFAQLNWFPNLGAGAPSNPCGNQQIYVNTSNGDLYTCTSAAWVKTGAGGGAGTVTSVTFTGDGTVLSATPSSAVTASGTVTAALANAAANTILGNGTGGSAAPTYLTVLPTAAVPAFTQDCTNSAGALALTCTQLQNGKLIVASGGTVSKYNNISTAAQGLTWIPAAVTCTTASQTTSIGPTALITTPAAGMYRFAAFMSITVAATGGTFVPTVTFTSDGHSYSANTTAAVTATGQWNSTLGVADNLVFYADNATTINYTITASSVTGSPTIRYCVVLERMQ